MEAKLTNIKGLKTYLNTRKSSKSSNAVNSKDSNNEPLTTKDAIRFLLQGTLKWRVCRFCLITTTNLSELDEILEVGSSGATYQVTIRDMIATFYPFQVTCYYLFTDFFCIHSKNDLYIANTVLKVTVRKSSLNKVRKQES